MKTDEHGALHLSAVMGLTVLALAMAALLGALLPASDAALGAEAPGAPREYSQQQVDGRKIYVREGCFTCHTQMVRDSISDRPLGPLSRAGDYNNEAPNLIGLDRIGPDLTCVGNRMGDRGEMTSFLKRPDTVHEGSDMPRYGFLTLRELQLLATYLVGLQCEGAEG